MTSLAIQIWKWCIERRIFLTAEYLPGVLNQVADEELRTVRDHCDWMIYSHLFSQIDRKLGPLEVDLFASRLTRQLPWYFSWRPDPATEATYAFTQDWSQLRGYANPPWCLLLTTLAKIQHEGHGGSGGTCMEGATVVSSPTPTVERVSSPDSNARECGHITYSGGVHHANRSTSVGCMAVIWQQCQSGGLSEGALRLLESSWRDKTR